MGTMGRRDFLRTSAVTAGAAAFSINALGANERVVIGMMGCGGRGGFLAQEFAKRDDVEIRWVADPDSRRHGSMSQAVEKAKGQRPKATQDFRNMLDDPEVDAIVSATPDHWHAPAVVYACQAGKDIYVEKPVSHSIWEGRKMVEAARKYNRVVQVGAQCRSAEYCAQAFEYLRSPEFGDIHFVRVLNSKLRSDIGKKPDMDQPPEGVDYDMWLGPAPMRKFNENHFHYAWHWFWRYSGGDIINDGVHQIDIARWLIDKPYPKSAVAAGGIWYYNDDQETPDTHTVNWDYDGLTMVFEQALWAPYMTKTDIQVRDQDIIVPWAFNGTRIEIYGTKQIMFLGRHGDGWEAFDASGKSIHIQHGGYSSANTAHVANFIDCIRSRALPNADIEKLHQSTLLCHYGNIAYRTGQKVHINPETEGFIDNDAANALVKREYREPWVVPETV